MGFFMANEYIVGKKTSWSRMLAARVFVCGLFRYLPWFSDSFVDHKRLFRAFLRNLKIKRRCHRDVSLFQHRWTWFYPHLRYFCTGVNRAVLCLSSCVGYQINRIYRREISEHCSDIHIAGRSIITLPFFRQFCGMCCANSVVFLLFSRWTVLILRSYEYLLHDDTQENSCKIYRYLLLFFDFCSLFLEHCSCISSV